jgi:hypothetical protein
MATTTPYASGEFSPIGNRPFGNTVAIFNGQLWVIGAGTAETTDKGYPDQYTTASMWQSTFDLSLDIPSQVTNSANWNSQKVAMPKFQDQGPSTFTRAAAAVCTGNAPGLYLFWNQNALMPAAPVTGHLLVSQYLDDGSGAPAWQSPLQLCEQGQSAAIQTSSQPTQSGYLGGDVSAVAFGADTFIVACANTSPGKGQGPCLFLGVYNTGDIDAGAWPASWQCFLTQAELQALVPPIGNPAVSSPPTITNIGTSVSLTWFSSAATGSSGNASPQFYAAVFITPEFQGSLKGSYAACLLLPLDATGTPPTGTFPYYLGFPTNYPTGPVGTVRDPGGRVLAYAAWPAGKQLVCDEYATAGLPTVTVTFEGGSYTYPVQTSVATQPASGTDQSDPLTPAVGFVVDMSSQPDPCSANEPKDDYPVSQFAFYGGASSDVVCQVDQIGVVEVLCDYATYAPYVLQGTTQTPAYIVNGIIDGPIPLPNQNIVNYPFQDSVPDCGDVQYGYTETEEASHQTSFSETWGFQTQLSSQKGWGPAFDIAASAGPGSATGSSTATSASAMLTQTSHIQTGTVNTVPDTGVAVNPDGNLYASTASIQTTAYRFLVYDASGNLVPVSDATTSETDQAPKCAMIQVTFTDEAGYSYTPYMVTPGDLASYTPEQINATMVSLGYTDNDGNNYFGNVIVKNAYYFPSTEPGGGMVPYIQYSWGANGTITGGFGAATTSFTESSWTFDGSFYAGVSGGEDASIFGLGLGFAFQFLVGTTVSYTAQTTTTSGQQWGVNITPDTWGPPPWYSTTGPGYEQAMQEYAFRLYFLPPPAGQPNYWTQELIKYLPKVEGQQFTDVSLIDPQSGPWRIVYVVVAYASNDGTNTYTYNGALGGEAYAPPPNPSIVRQRRRSKAEQLDTRGRAWHGR